MVSAFMLMEERRECHYLGIKRGHVGREEEGGTGESKVFYAIYNERGSCVFVVYCLSPSFSAN